MDSSKSISVQLPAGLCAAITEHEGPANEATIEQLVEDIAFRFLQASQTIRVSPKAIGKLMRKAGVIEFDTGYGVLETRFKSSPLDCIDEDIPVLRKQK